jgi:hypothetical protein
MYPDDLDQFTRGYIERLLTGCRLVEIDSDVEIYSIENYPAAAFWSVDTDWCISDPLYYWKYKQDGPLILFRSRKRSKDYLWHPITGEFRNSRNKRCCIQSFWKSHPTARTIFDELNSAMNATKNCAK